MKFNSQICTTREQSERLIALGLKKETADLWWVELENGSYALCIVGQYFPKDAIPAWSLHRLLSLYNLHYIEFMNDEEIESVYDIVIDAITQAIEGSYFNEKYLV